MIFLSQLFAKHRLKQSLNPKDFPKQSDRLSETFVLIRPFHKPRVALDHRLRPWFHVSANRNLLNAG